MYFGNIKSLSTPYNKGYLNAGLQPGPQVNLLFILNSFSDDPFFCDSLYFPVLKS